MFQLETSTAYFRGDFRPFKDCNVSICSTALLYGLGVFTGIRAYWNESERRMLLFRPDEHYRRFTFACKLLNYQKFLQEFTKKRFTETIVETLRRNSIAQDVYVRVSNFTDEDRITPKLIGYNDSFYVFCYPMGDYVSSGGLKCKVSSWVRIEDNAIPARAKIHGSYVNSAFAKTEALQHGYDEAIFLDRQGHVLEGSSENIFLMIDGVLCTPPLSDNILEGITRKSILALAKDEGVPVQERSIDRSELYKADEIFLTGSAAKVAPVVQVDQYPVGDGRVGPVSVKFQQLYEKVARGAISKYREWVYEV